MSTRIKHIPLLRQFGGPDTIGCTRLTGIRGNSRFGVFKTVIQGDTPIVLILYLQVRSAELVYVYWVMPAPYSSTSRKLQSRIHTP
ncbi:hypothetical protein RSAG8_13903, partial [Rhizoctonia solani AG-8 WAC10335]